MRVLRSIEVNLSAGQTDTYDIEAMGARGFIYTSERDEGTLVEITQNSYSGSQGQRILRYVPTGGGGTDETVSIGYPLNAQTLQFGWSGAGLRNGRIAFLDEPIAPFGRVPVRRWTGNLAAAGTVALVTTEFLGLFKEIQLITMGDQEHHYNLGYQNMALAQTLTNFIAVAAATGGYTLSPRVPCPRQYSLTLVNDDGANAINYSGVIFGFFS